MEIPATNTVEQRRRSSASASSAAPSHSCGPVASSSATVVPWPGIRGAETASPRRAR